MIHEFPKSGRWVKRVMNSSDGNPCYRVYFDDGTNALTKRDASVAYKVTNPEFDGHVIITLDDKGELIDIRQHMGETLVVPNVGDN